MNSFLHNDREVSMAYCLAMRMQAGLVSGSDTRTSAGVDYVTSYNKTHCFTPSDDRVFVLLTAGNLATTQEVSDCLQRDLDRDVAENLNTMSYLFEAAAYVGRVSQKVQANHRHELNGIDGSATFILGGQLRDHMPNLRAFALPELALPHLTFLFLADLNSSCSNCR